MTDVKLVRTSLIDLLKPYVTEGMWPFRFMSFELHEDYNIDYNVDRFTIELKLKKANRILYSRVEVPHDLMPLSHREFVEWFGPVFARSLRSIPPVHREPHLILGEE